MLLALPPGTGENTGGAEREGKCRRGCDLRERQELSPLPGGFGMSAGSLWLQTGGPTQKGGVEGLPYIPMTSDVETEAQGALKDSHEITWVADKRP